MNKTKVDNPGLDDLGPSGAAGLIPFDDWLKGLGCSRATGYRYRRRGYVKAINIFGRLYITPTEIKNFLARAEAGEFARRYQPFAKRPIKL